MNRGRIGYLCLFLSHCRLYWLFNARLTGLISVSELKNN
ncbi:hypothetical protein Asd1617_05972 [Shigella dysenteriae 1617]|uniref:Uncharacterized protein n=1 Tax=Shigella dysenteriae 1617 TaxID=754093 RepID=A0A0A7A427_SHIDY|nr:hypothetical protein Asd1617_05972 [Shigella dysenteriae 1617]